MEQIHTFDARKSTEYRYMKSTLGGYSSEYFQVFITVSESHSRLVERIFYVEDIFITREIIIKNTSGSNDNIFFSIIHRTKSLVFLGLGQLIRYNERGFRINGMDFQICLDSEIVGKY